MSDQQHPQAQLCLKLTDKVQYLRLNRDIEGGRRFVRYQQKWITRNRHGDHNALALSTRKLVRIVPNSPRGVC
jgi:hypothetical protein